MSKGIINFVKSIWQILHAPDNDQIVIALTIACAALLFSHFWSYLSYRRIFKEKDKELEDVKEQRNLFQATVLKQVGGKRVSSKKKPNIKNKEE